MIYCVYSINALLLQTNIFSFHSQSMRLPYITAQFISFYLQLQFIIYTLLHIIFYNISVSFYKFTCFQLFTQSQKFLNFIQSFAKVNKFINFIFYFSQHFTSRFPFTNNFFKFLFRKSIIFFTCSIIFISFIFRFLSFFSFLFLF